MVVVVSRGGRGWKWEMREVDVDWGDRGVEGGKEDVGYKADRHFGRDVD